MNFSTFQTFNLFGKTQFHAADMPKTIASKSNKLSALDRKKRAGEMEFLKLSVHSI